jgi:hypothetical protein
MHMTTNESTPIALAKALADVTEAKSRLTVAFSDFRLFDTVPTDKAETSRDRLLASDQTYDFVVADLPLGTHRVSFTDHATGTTIKTRQNWIDIYTASTRLKKAGLAVVVLEPAFWSKDWGQFATILAANGVYQIAVVRFPHLPYAGTSIPATLGVFARQERDFLFVADATPRSSARVLAEAIASRSFGTTINDGLAVQHKDFRGIDQLAVESEMRALETQYKGYRQCRLVPDLASPDDVHLCRSGESHIAHENAIYIPRIGNSPVITRLDTATLKHHNYIQVVLSSTDVTPEYLALYFRSHLGKLTLRVLVQGAFIPHLPKSALDGIVVPVPERCDQDMIILAHARLLDLDKALTDFRAELSLNPRSASSLVEHASAMLQQVHRLSAADQLLALIRTGESSTLEFKQTLSLDIKKGTKEAYIEKMILKTIAAFLNSQGGTLLVGISDDGRIAGLRSEMDAFFKGSRDDLLKHFKNILKRSIGEVFYPLIDYDTVDVNGEQVLRVDCRPSDKECFLDSTEFYVRTNPATDQLNGQKMLEYIRRRFKS